MKRNSYLKAMLLFLLCFVLTLPVLAEESTEEDGDWILICYLADESVDVMIHAGSAIANLWEPETVWGEEFWYWTTRRTDPFNEKYKVTKETVFYETTFLYPVTEGTAEELEETKEFAENWQGGGTEQTTEEERDYYIVHFHECNGSDWYWSIETPKNKAMGDISDITDMLKVKKGCKFAGWYTEENGGGKKFTAKTKVKSDMDVYAYWVDDGCYTVTYMKNYGTDEQNVMEIGIEETKATLTAGPKISRKGYKLLGWYTKPKGGKRVKMGSKLTSDLTLYAHWEKVKVQRASIRQLYGRDRAITVKYKKQSGVKGYQVQISTSKTFAKKKTITKTYNNNSTFKRTIKRLKKGQTYYLRVRAYKKDSAGCRVYGKWSKAKMIKTK